MATTSYLTFVEKITQGVTWAVAAVARRLFGLYGVFANGFAQAHRQTFINLLPGHPEQPRDALDQMGSDRRVIYYPGESRDLWTERIANVWDSNYYAGTPNRILEAVDEWGSALYPDSWVNEQCYIEEDPDWSVREPRFEIYMPRSLTLWDGPLLYGDPGVNFGTDYLYGSAANGTHISLLKKTIRKYKRSSSRCRVVVFDSDPENPLFYIEVA
jgi:hypothetical protein